MNQKVANAITFLAGVASAGTGLIAGSLTGSPLMGFGAALVAFPLFLVMLSKAAG